MTWLLLLSTVFAAPTVSIPSSYNQLRDLHVFVRVPTEACQANEKLIVGLGGAVEAQQNSVVADLKDISVKKTDEQFLKEKTQNCVADCGCEAVSAVMKALPKKANLESLIAQADKSAASMTDKDYSLCQKTKKVHCADKGIQEALKQAEESIDKD